MVVGFSGSPSGQPQLIWIMVSVKVFISFRHGLGRDLVKGVQRSGTRPARIEGDDPLQVYRSFVGITCGTRVPEGR